MIVTGDELRPYFEAGAGPTDANASFIGRWENDRLLGVMATFNWSGHDAEVGWVGEPGWLTRGFLKMMRAYWFDQLKLHRITGRIDCDNATPIKQCQRLGFVYEGTLREASKEGKDVLIYGLLARDCPSFTRNKP